MMPLNMTGKQFGRLAVKRRNGRQAGHINWLCRCDCGATSIVLGIHLRSGHTTSCGCLKLELMSEVGKSNRTHGHSTGGKVSSTFRTWTSMHTRCNNPRSDDYEGYGGRGISICKRWNRFEHFLVDMGIKPVGMTLERKNNNGNYTPRNCRWATPTDQSRNQRSNRLLSLAGNTQCVAAWAEEYGLKADTVRKRLNRGDAPSRALRPV